VVSIENRWLVHIKKMISLKSRVFTVVMHVACNISSNTEFRIVFQGTHSCTKSPLAAREQKRIPGQNSVRKI
jgi:hypothetical protein